MPVLLDAVLESYAALGGGECDRRDRAARIVNRHGEAAADAELRCFFKKSALRL
jgi:hypothetical protein